MIVDFKYYVSNFNGNIIPIDKFDSFMSKSERFLKSKTDTYTIDDTSDRIKDALCAFAEVYYQASINDGISSESNDGVSISYVDKAKTLEADLIMIYNNMLSNSDYAVFGWC